MKTTMDAAGRLVIPRAIREAARLSPGAPLEVRWRDGRIEIEPQPLPVELVRQGHLTVAMPHGRVPPLRAEQVEHTRRVLRRNRAGTR